MKFMGGDGRSWVQGVEYFKRPSVPHKIENGFFESFGHMTV
jgi:hypothetical protein